MRSVLETDECAGVAAVLEVTDTTPIPFFATEIWSGCQLTNGVGRFCD